MYTRHTYEQLNHMVGSGSIIFNEDGEPFKQSHNLRGILSHATRRGVLRLHVDTLNEGPGRPGALMTVFYRGGDVGKIYFVDAGHAQNWAFRQKAAHQNRSWFHGCEVTVKPWAAGTWGPFNQGAPA